MREASKGEQLLNPILKNRGVAWLLVLVGLTLSCIDNFLKMDLLVGSWHIISYLLLLLPLLCMIWRKKSVNPHTIWFIPFLLVMIGDMFYYNNEIVQYFLPTVFYLLVFILYMTSMHTVHSLHQTIFIRIHRVGGISYLKEFFRNLFVSNLDRKLYTRIGVALLITLPFLFAFGLLLASADSHYGALFEKLLEFDIPFEAHYIVTFPLMFIVYLLLFVYSFSNHVERREIKETQKSDMVIVSIFLVMINLLFTSFIALQIPFLSSGSIPEGTTVADFAREGFFQLMMVMGLVSLIFLYIFRRHKGEKLTTFLLIGLLVQTIVMGIVSLKKMVLYQSLMGATVLRYYVEWFDYLLLLVLTLGIVFLIKQYAFSKLLDLVVLLSVASFTLIVSLNIDAMVAEHNIVKFKETPEKLDRRALTALSIDALPVVAQHAISLNSREVFPWVADYRRKKCSSFAVYHAGYCSILKKYGTKK